MMFRLDDLKEVSQVRTQQLVNQGECDHTATTKNTRFQLKPYTTMASAVPAAGACSVSVAAIRKMLKPTASAASTLKRSGTLRRSC